MALHEISTIISLALAGMLGVAGCIHFCGPRLLLQFYPWRDFAQTRHRFSGALRTLSALFLAVPEMRIWGGGLAAAIAFVAVIAQLQNARYLHAIPGIVVLIVVPIVIASATLF